MTLAKHVIQLTQQVRVLDKDGACRSCSSVDILPSIGHSSVKRRNKCTMDVQQFVRVSGYSSGLWDKRGRQTGDIHRNKCAEVGDISMLGIDQLVQGVSSALGIF
jgi:hypothetical protein